jgi:hypothetical protein
MRVPGIWCQVLPSHICRNARPGPKLQLPFSKTIASYRSPKTLGDCEDLHGRIIADTLGVWVGRSEGDTFSKRIRAIIDLIMYMFIAATSSSADSISRTRYRWMENFRAEC